jgi:hypothetical protein
MTDRKQPKGGVLDPDWEESLRRGQEAEGEKGSVEAELAVVHVLRHARAPEEIEDAKLDEVWGQVHGEVSPAPWWKRPWMIWAPVAAAAAVVVFVVVQPPKDDATVAVADTAGDQNASESKKVASPPAELEEAEGEAVMDEAASRAAAAPAATPGGTGMAATLEKQFAMLEPEARAQIDGSIETERGSLRSGLLNSALGGGK